MGAGIVSIALSLDGAQTISRILLAIDALTWLILVVLLPARVVRDHEEFRADVRTPPALTAVAGSAVLGTRLTMLGWWWAAIPLLVISLVAWAALLGPVLSHWQTPTRGASLLLAVSIESLAVLAAVLAVHAHAGWLLTVALVACGLGLIVYVLVIARFDGRQLVVGGGDQWICGGALAISCLAAVKLAAGAGSLAFPSGVRGVLDDVAVGLWVVTMLWLPVLIYTEARHPRPRYTVRRWSTVFPIGMYAACSFAVGVTARAGAITAFARAWTWVALAVWVIVAAGTLHRGTQIIRSPLPVA